MPIELTSGTRLSMQAPLFLVTRIPRWCPGSRTYGRCCCKTVFMKPKAAARRQPPVRSALACGRRRGCRASDWQLRENKGPVRALFAELAHLVRLARTNDTGGALVIGDAPRPRCPRRKATPAAPVERPTQIEGDQRHCGRANTSCNLVRTQMPEERAVRQMRPLLPPRVHIRIRACPGDECRGTDD